jgi:hypothetical protein
LAKTVINWQKKAIKLLGIKMIKFKEKLADIKQLGKVSDKLAEESNIAAWQTMIKVGERAGRHKSAWQRQWRVGRRKQ